MNEHIFTTFNKLVKPNDHLFLLGDLAFRFKSLDDYINILLKLNCNNIYLILGNHDNRINLQRAVEKIDYKVTLLGDYSEISIDGRMICMMHYPIAMWNNRFRDSWMFYGHCISERSQILTNNGWKTYNTLDITKDKVYSDKGDNKIVLEKIDKLLIYPNYSGKTINQNFKNFNLNVTDKHKIAYYTNGNKLKYINADSFKYLSKPRIRVSGISDAPGLNWKNGLLELYILIAADGSIKRHTNLCRIKVKKPHKIKYINYILNKCEISYKTYIQKENSISFNFYLPDEFNGLNIKGLDSVLLNCNREDCLKIIEAYRNSDGCINGKGTLIYSSKEQEIDLLQHIFITNGFLSSKYSRVHGFSINPSFQLSVYPKQFINLYAHKNLVTKEVDNKLYWCINTKYKNFFTRLDGKVHLTGNCHARFDNGPKSIDVGIDNYFKLFGEYKPFNWKELQAILSKGLVN